MGDGPVRTNVIHRGLTGGNSNAKVTGATEDPTLLVPVFRRAPGITTGIARLWDFLIDNAIEILLDVQMIMAVENDSDVILNE